MLLVGDGLGWFGLDRLGVERSCGDGRLHRPWHSLEHIEMRYAVSWMVVGVVGLAATLGCTKTKPAADASAQQPPKIEFEKPQDSTAAVDRANPAVPNRPAPPASSPTAKTSGDGPPGAGKLPELRAALAAAADEDGRVLAVDAIADLGQSAFPALDDLLKAMSDENIRLRWHAARAVGQIGEDAISALPKLVALLKDADPVVATQATAAIAAIRADDNRKTFTPEQSKPYSDALDALAESTVHPDARVRRGALRAITVLQPDPAKLAELFNRQLSDADPSVIMPALMSLADLGPQAVPQLIESLKDPKARYWATVALTEIGADAAPAAAALTSAAMNGEPEERMQAMLALAAIGEPAAEAADELATALESSDTAVQSSAAYALGRMRVASADAALEKASTNSDAFLASIAAWARARIHPDDKALVGAAAQTLTAALGSDRANTRVAAMSALADLAGSIDDAEEHLLAEKFVTLLEDDNPGVRAAAATSLVRLGPTAMAALEGALEKPSIRTLVMELLAAGGSKAKPAVDTLIKTLSDTDPEARGNAAVALASIGTDAAEAVPALAALLAEKEEVSVRYAAAYALGSIGPAASSTAESLRGLAKSSDTLMASVAVWALLKIEPGNVAQFETAVPVLRKALRSDRDLARVEAAAALGDIGKAASSAIPILELVCEDDPVGAVRKAAAEALVKIKAAR